MRTLLFGAAVSAMLAPAAAHAQTTGFIDTAYEYSEVRGGGSADSWNLGVGVQHDFANGWGVQADGRTTHFDNNVSTPSTGYGAVHVYADLTQAIDVAAYLGAIDWTLYSARTIGVEARLEQSQWSLQGALGYARFNPTIGTPEVWDARVLGAWFVNSDTAVEPTLSYTEWHDPPSTYKQFAVGVGLAHRFGNGLEISARYIHNDNDSSTGGKYQAHTWRIGVRLHLNAGDLQAVTNDGASWYGAAGLYEALGRF